MSDSSRAHLQALLTRAAIIESVRQKAARERDTVAATACERELAQLREAYRAKCPFLTAKR